MYRELLEALSNDQELNAAQIAQLLQGIADEQLTDVQILGLQMAFIMKGATTGEFDQVVQCLRQMRTPLTVETKAPLLELTGVPEASTLLCAAAGAPIAHHVFGPEQDRWQALKALGRSTPEQDAARLQEMGFACLQAERYLPMLHRALPADAQPWLRELYAVVLAPLTHPAPIASLFCALADEEQLPRLQRLAGQAGISRLLLACSRDGGIVLNGPTQMQALLDGELHSFTITPEDLGMQRCTERLVRQPLSQLPKLVEAVLQGELTGPERDAAVAHAAAGLYAAGLAKTLEEGVQLALRALQTGDAAKLLHELQVSAARSG